MTQMCATERRDVAAAYGRLEGLEAWIPVVLTRLRPWLPLQPGDRVLDVGAAQGVTVTALRRAGFDACGVEPYGPALEVARQLEELTGVPTMLTEGWAEDLPFRDESFRYLHAISLMEHVDDPVRVLREAYRVLEPGGGLYFKTGSVLNPRQGEIAGFPLFPWYPAPLQRRIMVWARDHRPELVGHTPRPAMHWFRHGEVRRWLEDIGFRTVVDRWTLHSRSGEHTGLEGRLVDLASRNRGVRLIGNVARGSIEYLAIK